MLETKRIVTVTLHPAVDHVIEVKELRLCATCTGRMLGHYPAGKGVNVARVAGILGVDAIATGFVGDGEISAFERHLADFGCSRAQFLPVHGRTRNNITIIDPSRQEHTHIRTSGFAVRDDDLERVRRKLMLLSRPDTAMVFAGSLPPGVEVEAFGTLLDDVGRQGAPIVIDTSGEALRVLRERRSALVKVNQAELAELTGEQCDGTESAVLLARDLVARERADAVVVTLASEGAVLVRAEEAWRAYVEFAADEQIANTVGGGDAFLAGLLVGLQRSQGVPPGKRWRAGMRLAVAAASANAITSRAAVVDAQDVERFLERVEFASAS